MKQKFYEIIESYIINTPAHALSGLEAEDFPKGFRENDDVYATATATASAAVKGSRAARAAIKGLYSGVFSECPECGAFFLDDDDPRYCPDCGHEL